jgi:hypothetical protein
MVVMVVPVRMPMRMIVIVTMVVVIVCCHEKI